MYASARLLRLAPLRAPASRIMTRSVQTSAKPYNGVPFDYTNKRALAFKFIAFWGGGFAIPFIAGYYQLRKSGGAKA
ncbi:hypothetical protein BV25DRAFT_1822131 [Artomyces pyxidatus]|uniref:Uncharacterized protein n=1 Tax=Artomyces pyxidatus TaxID=48021 RepID=A0ACB8T8A4_9AGAM|nr:hypothetical protein BV25DRAFT_1822131 [Artomyces pyxidatus]